MHARVHNKTHAWVSLVALAWVSLTSLYGFMELALLHSLAYPTEFSPRAQGRAAQERPYYSVDGIEWVDAGLGYYN